MYNVLYCTPLFFSPYCDARDLHSFPTRRSSDLAFGEGWVAVGDAAQSYDPLSSQGLRYALESGIRAAFAVDAALDGDHRHLERYQMLLELQRTRYERLHRQFYGLVRRWPASPFWRRRLTRSDWNDRRTQTADVAP